MRMDENEKSEVELSDLYYLLYSLNVNIGAFE